MTQPVWATGPAQSLVLSDGQTVLTWERIISPEVWIAREDHPVADGVIMAGPTTLHAAVTPDDLGVDAARRIAADLLAAVDLVADHD